MSSELPAPATWGLRLTKALQAVRKARGLTAGQVADLMGMDRRNYTNFEAGKGRLNLTRLLSFAQVTDSDGWAILAAVLGGAEQLAPGAADNKMLLAFFLLLGEFEERFGGDLRLLDTADVVSAFSAAFKTLESVLAEKRARLPADWLREGAAKLGPGSSARLNEDEPT
ncbi:MAG TPA: helix-turn-helix transcriptional regulator [Phenylobacterium sp.]|nr:helix-turn-helix transcriptional regulator [Phenylobacterium sp.]